MGPHALDPLAWLYPALGGFTKTLFELPCGLALPVTRRLGLLHLPLIGGLIINSA